MISAKVARQGRGSFQSLASILGTACKFLRALLGRIDLLPVGRGGSSLSGGLRNRRLDGGQTGCGGR